MKTILNKILILILFVIGFTACKSDDMNFSDAKVTAVNTLYEPSDDKAINLTPTGSLYFSWEPAAVEDGGSPLYEVLFDKVDGNFSNPIYVATSDQNGYSNGASVTHKILSKVAGYAGAEPGETATVKWTVRSSRGINQAVSPASRELTLTRFVGFAELPDQVFITGSGSEAGDDIANAMQMTRTAQGEYEIYIKLIPGGTYKFVDAKAGTPREFYIENNMIKEGAESTSNTLNGVFRISLDFNTASPASPIEITNVGFWFCPSNKSEWNLAYAGEGIWKGSGPVNFKQESWGRDQRYKFRVTTKDSSGTTIMEDWGPKNMNEDGTPSGAASYYEIKTYITSSLNDPQWNPKWKFASEFDGANVNLTVKMSGEQYTHEVSK
ncbi:SusE domain-containing protein [Dysgonomonas termitidis]|uniref:SusE domain-containing protein n=1 Tax=Dysgonomonas termitidis TaxID=1516126 RepID=A0ABV9L1S3_9BACT